MRSRVWLSSMLIGACGCGFQSQPADPTATVDASQPSQPPGDAGSDAPQAGSDAPLPPACKTFSSLVDTCTLTFDHDVTLNAGAVYDTTNAMLDGASVEGQILRSTMTLQGVDIEVIRAHNVNLPAGLVRAIGSRPLAILATGTITIGNNVVLDVGSGGAGARSTCASGPGGGESDDSGGAGGGGGGFAGPGGKGGNGNSNVGAESRGGAGGAASAMPASVQGGCPGASGGQGRGSQSSRAVAGVAGGAIYLAAAGGITLGDQAVINAGGGGGRRGTSDEGGGSGGGSGGMIFLEAAKITGATASVTANGGGGGGGTDIVATTGQDGSNGLTSTTPAPGGNGSPDGAPGAPGGAGGHTNGNDVGGKVPAAGGGGGGGACGFIRVKTASQNIGTFSPPAAISP